jgi:oxalate---CoA ligase
VLEAYAMTEAAHQMTSNPLPPGARKPGSVGPGQGVEIAILDQEGNHVPHGGEGEICVKGENVTPGYLNNAKANAESFTSQGWFRTGDQGRLDPDGYVFITGRIKEFINRGFPL